MLLLQRRADLDRQHSMMELGRIVGGVAHDINNMVFAVQTTAEAVLEEVGDDHPSSDYLREVRKIGGGLTRHLDALLSFAKARRLQLEPGLLRETMQAVITEVQPGLQRALEIEWDMTHMPDPMVPINQTALKQLADLVLSNASRAMPQGGRVKIAVYEAAGTARLEVSDEGVGMSNDTLRRCLEPYYSDWGFQAHGMGLSVAYGIAQSLNASMRVESERDVGTTVSLSIPMTGKTS